MEREEWFDRLSRMQTELGRERWDYWREQVLFTFDWWALLFFCAVGWVLWWRIFDRSRILSLASHGLVVLLTALGLDVVGAELGFWDYPVMVLPWGARLVVVDAVLPVFYMAAYQFSGSIRSYLLIVTGMSLLFSFVMEPLMVAIGVYRPLLWKHFFSVPGYVGVGAWAYLWTAPLSRALMDWSRIRRERASSRG